jgi:hypothetical protein
MMISIGRWAGVISLLGALACAPSAGAQVYNWVEWASVGQTAAATEPSMGTVTLSLEGAGLFFDTTFPVRFSETAFSPVDAPSVAISATLFQNSSFVLDFSEVPGTGGVIVGIGNFGHGTSTLRGYRLAAFDTLGDPMPLTALEQIGSYDHVWTDYGIPFNDDVALDTGSGRFVVTAVPGQNDNNSDILLMSLPAGVWKLIVSTNEPTDPETVNVVIASACPSDFDHNSFVNGDDADAFAAAFDLGDPSADVDGNGFTNGDDADYFAAHFDAGC